MQQDMSNKKARRVQLKLDVTQETKDKLTEASVKTGLSMTLIVQTLIKYYLTPLDIEHDVRRSLAEFSKKNTTELKLSKRQKRILENATEDSLVTHLR